MRKIVIALILGCLFCIKIVAGQTNAKKDSAVNKAKSKSVFFKNIRLRQSFETSDQVSEPAQIQVSAPDKGKVSWLLDAGLSADIARISNTTTSNVTVEYHRNTLISSEQNNFQAGYGLSYFGDKPSGLNSIITLNLKFIRDWQEPSTSAAITGNYTLFNQGKGLRLNQAGYLNNRAFTYNLNPYVGFEYQYLGGTPANNGNILRPLANVSAAIALNKKQTPQEAANSKPSKTIELTAGYIMRYAVVNSTGDDEGYSQLLKAGVNYYIIDSKTLNAAIGACYKHGSDPLAGLAEQSFWQVTLQFEFSRKR